MAHSRTRVRYPLRLRARRFATPRQRRRVPALPKTSTSVSPSPGAVTATVAVLVPSAVAVGVTVTATVVTATGSVSTATATVPGDTAPLSITFGSSADLTDNFEVSRFRTQWEDEQGSLEGQDCTQGFGPDIGLGSDIRVDSGKLEVETAMQNYGDTLALCKYPWSGEGTIEFDVKGDEISNEAQVTILLLDRPYPWTGFDGENADGPKPQYGIRISTVAGQAPLGRVFDDYVQTDYYEGGSPGPPAGVYDRTIEQHWVLFTDGDYIWLEIDGDPVDIGTDVGGTSKLPVPAGLTLAGSFLQIGTHNHASGKYSPFAETVTTIFDNVEFEAFAPARTAYVEPSGVVQFGWHLEAAGGTAPIVHETTSLALGTGATTAYLLCNVGAIDGDDIGTGDTFHWSLNGNTSHSVAFQLDEQTNHAAKWISTEVDVAELVQGVNEIEVWQTGVNGASFLRYANLALVVQGGTGAEPANVSAAVVTATASVIAPSAVAAGVGVSAATFTATGSTIAPSAVSAGTGADVSASTVTAAAGTLSATVATGAGVSAAVVTATVGVPAPSVSTAGNANVSAAVVTAAGVGIAPTAVAAGVTVTATVVTATVGTVAPTTGAGVTVTATVVTATGSAIAPSVSASGNVNVAAGTAAATASVITPAAISVGSRVSASTVTAATAALAAFVTVGLLASDVYRSRNAYREASSRGYREPQPPGYREPRSTGYGGN